MKTRIGILLAGFVCFVSICASADSIPITGGILIGDSVTTGDFNLSGPNLTLFQGAPDGPDSIGACTVGAVCNFKYTMPDMSLFCVYCTGLSGGSLGSKTVEFLGGNLTLTGSALFSGGSTLDMPLKITGTIIGYELVGCIDGVECSLGPKEFTLHIVASGIGVFGMLLGNPALMGGVTISDLTGTATTVPEPMSLALTGTGLIGVWIRWKIAQSR